MESRGVDVSGRVKAAESSNRAIPVIEQTLEPLVVEPGDICTPHVVIPKTQRPSHSPRVRARHDHLLEHATGAAHGRKVDRTGIASRASPDIEGGIYRTMLRGYRVFLGFLEEDRTQKMVNVRCFSVHQSIYRLRE
jgi:hypothetical protein